MAFGVIVVILVVFTGVLRAQGGRYLSLLLGDIVEKFFLKPKILLNIRKVSYFG